ncbi:AraC family transcriptional regulator [Chitinophaga lutea]|uniref:AraC family transcriptional regulator n=1 Tax=Chitinophaga lutea TaxID=2488634 RepID=A0A3N4Q3Z0_9BACT|nr:helix-turn-helix transcriptional regulator [Chitinophaga lutea]RPE12181.1 AraC family transcriptional regulator [Chitinophaga lutea]
MKKQQSVEAFYHDRGMAGEAHGLFNVFENETNCNEPHVYNRRDFYKISLLEGTSRLSWHHQEIEIDRPALVFFNPVIPFAWAPRSEEQPGYFCLFKKEFLQDGDRDEGLQNSPLLQPGHHPVFFPDKKQLRRLREIFVLMLAEIESDYVYKYDLLRNYLHLLIHEALKIKPGITGVRQKNAAGRIASDFLELLERQFPVDNPDRSLKLRTAGDFANALSVHVNHLNHAMQETTGRPTTGHISERILAEAKALLKHTDWPIAEIAYSLGFEYPNYFYNFFKKKTGHPPKSYRSRTL